MKMSDAISRQVLVFLGLNPDRDDVAVIIEDALQPLRHIGQNYIREGRMNVYARHSARAVQERVNRVLNGTANATAHVRDRSEAEGT